MKQEIFLYVIDVVFNLLNMLTMIIICTIRINEVTDEKIELKAESVVCLHPGNAFST